MADDLTANAKQGRILARQLCLFDDPGVTDEERAFCDEYLVNGFRGIEAVLKVRPQTNRNAAKVQAHRWLKKSDAVRAYLERRQVELALDARLEQSEVIDLYRMAALAGLGRIKLRRTVVGKSGAPIGDVEVYEPSLAAVNQAAAGLAKFLGIDEGGAEAIVVHLDLAGDGGKTPRGTDG